MAAPELKTKQCPFCGETIQAYAIKCRFCKEFLDTDKAKTLSRASDPDQQSGQHKEQSGNILFEGGPSLWGLAGTITKGLIVLGFVVFLMKLNIENLVNDTFRLKLTSEQLITFGGYRFIAGLGLVAFVLLIILVKIIQLKSIHYQVTADRIEWSRGIFDRKVDNLDMFRVVDLKLRRNLLDCIVGVGTVELITNDKTDPDFSFKKIHNCRKIYDIVKKVSLEADKQRGVFHLE